MYSKEKSNFFEQKLPGISGPLLHKEVVRRNRTRRKRKGGS